ncbi:type II toxin-antitoxin system RelE/ParE family toxin [Caulobacter sp. NIBR1757]|uniref:type II toxin-antitoxin system RelE/ParE family toxin n=1 Tax=Caulobacter sp. NIBR1757 TaxID=3016000 RepID=UPI0022F07AD6|nr:type II toxin-antitoxin system RelE/ParE family toxin [Caulobacter sp. NIBR1757]
MKSIWSGAARRDVLGLAEFLSERSSTAAARILRAIYARTDRLAREPLLGRVGRMEGTRERVVPRTPYLIVYRIQGEQVEILRVLHGAQDWPPAD